MTCATVNYINRRAEAIGGGAEARLLVASLELESLELQRANLLQAIEQQQRLMAKMADPIKRIDPGFCAVWDPYAESIKELLLQVRKDIARVGA